MPEGLHVLVCVCAAGKWPGSDPREVPNRRGEDGQAAAQPSKEKHTGEVSGGEERILCKSQGLGECSLLGRFCVSTEPGALIMLASAWKVSGSQTSTRSLGVCAVVGEQSFEPPELNTNTLVGWMPLSGDSLRGESRNLATAFLSCRRLRTVAHEGRETRGPAGRTGLELEPR